MQRRIFKKEKGFFNGQEMTTFLYKNRKGTYTGCITPSTRKGNHGYAHSFNVADTNIFVSHNSNKPFLLAKIKITGDNSRDENFTTFFGKVIKIIEFDFIKKSTYCSTHDNQFMRGDKRVGLLMFRGSDIQYAIDACIDDSAKSAFEQLPNIF